MEIVRNSAIRRLPTYYRHIIKMDRQGIEFTSARILSELTGVHKTQIRKDIALTGLVGVPRRGHNVKSLIKAIAEYLNWNDISSAFIVGAGNLGKALLNYDNFEASGMKIVAAFDTSVNEIGKEINGKEILPMDKFMDLTERLHINIGIITTPAEVAQPVADLMVQAGIKGIWNFTYTQLKVPEHIVVETVDLYRGLGVLSKRLAEQEKAEQNLT
ncbi:MAG: redox-sensing transcriptional repressor Rex [Candidatus Cloacimonadales bacterium]